MFLDVIPALLLKLRYNIKQKEGKPKEDIMQTTVIYSDGQTLKTNSILRKWLGRQKKFIAIIEGDSLIIKKPHSLLDFSAEPDEDFMTMEEINKEIHKARKENEHSR